MAERFEKLFCLPANLYSADSPVIVAAGALLKDTETGRIIVQLKYHSVSTMPIKALKVGISAYDIAGKEIGGIEEYQYLDLNIYNGQEFGSNKAIVMPNAVTRSFSISNITVVLSDGTPQNVAMPLATLPQNVPVQSVLKNTELIKQYQLAVNSNATYAPQEYTNLWSCSCGTWNGDQTCTTCKAKRQAVLGALNIPTLTENMEIRLATEKAEREKQAQLAEIARQEAEELARIKKEETAKKKKTFQKILFIACASAAAIALTIFVVSTFIKNSTYKNAIKLEEAGNYEEALLEFSGIEDYKDSAEHIEAINNYLIYNSALTFENVGNYEDALYEFSRIANYKDSNAHLEEIINLLVFTDDYLSVRKAVEYLEIYPNGHEDLLQLCRYIHSVEDNLYSLYISSYGTISLSADYYLYNGIPYANVIYDNYLGELQDKADVKLSSDTNYLVEVNAIGIFKNEAQEMNFFFGEETAYTDHSKGYEFEFEKRMGKQEYKPPVSEQQKKQTQENIEYGSAFLGRSADSSGSIDVSDEEYTFLTSDTELFGITGRFTHGFSSSVRGMIDIMDWISNDSTNDFDSIINGLVVLYGDDYRVQHYDDASGDAYMWKNVDKYEYVICWQNANGTVDIRWTI